MLVWWNRVWKEVVVVQDSLLLEAGSDKVCTVHVDEELVGIV